jgi:hypothetical protein
MIALVKTVIEPVKVRDGCRLIQDKDRCLNGAMSRKPVTHWTIDELNKVVARKFQTAKKYQPGPERQKLLREAKRYQSLLETKKSISAQLQPPA